MPGLFLLAYIKCLISMKMQKILKSKIMKFSAKSIAQDIPIKFRNYYKYVYFKPISAIADIYFYFYHFLSIYNFIEV